MNAQTLPFLVLSMYLLLQGTHGNFMIVAVYNLGAI
jgi:hypothetical protein